MTNLSWDSNSYFLDGAPGFLVSGEFHYFRVPKADWARRLDLLKEAGASCVATYIPWGLHEPSEGLFRFSDGPETDLEGFLDLCREKELNVIARPGPYQYSEMRYCGLPRWLMKEHPEIYSRKEDGTPHGS
ncbi:MAG: beta-galactosidase, partial [Defluviitaleaceae bacterium]|nr:beta-galactosidase [Defluviitaleaceae bacterium]